jgi:uncharacterized damage-inducible protein DinB
MAELFDEYRCRVLGYLGSRDPMLVLAATPRKLAQLIAGRSRRELERRPKTGKWSVQEIIAHLADAELAFAWRIRNVTVTPGVALQWWDEHLWAEALGYVRIPVQASLAAFVACRKSNTDMLRRVPPAAWRRAHGVHAKRGRQTLQDFVTMEAAHDLNHIRQIEALLKGRLAR